MPVSLNQQTQPCTLYISGKFTFEIHREIRRLSEQALNSNDCPTLDIDLSGVGYLDSSALGMLLLIRDKAAPLNKPLRLTGATGITLNILRTVKFDEMFDFA
jgi:anti-anti-sigma factor